MAKTYVAKIEKNYVKVYDSKSSTMKTCFSVKGPTSAVASGEDVHVTCADGRVRVYTASGMLRRIV